MKAKPLQDCVLVRQTAAPSDLGSILVPERARIRPRSGVVVAVGGGVFETRPGDSILFDLDGGTEVDLNRERLLVVRESSIIGVLE